MLGHRHETEVDRIRCSDSDAWDDVTSAQEPPLLGDLWLEGTVGQAKVRVYLEDAGFPKTDGLWGMYYYSTDWIPIAEADRGETVPAEEVLRALRNLE